MLVTDFGLATHLVAVCRILIPGLPVKKNRRRSRTRVATAQLRMLPTAATALSAAQTCFLYISFLSAVKHFGLDSHLVTLCGKLGDTLRKAE